MVCAVRTFGLIVVLATSTAFADDAERAYRVGLKAFKKKERAFFRTLPERVQDVFVPWWRLTLAQKRGRSLPLRATYAEYAELQRDRVRIAETIAREYGDVSLPCLWRDVLATVDEFERAGAAMAEIVDPGTAPISDPDTLMRHHGAPIRLDGLLRVLANVAGGPGFLATRGWKEASKRDGRKSITRRVAVLDALALARDAAGAPVVAVALASDVSSLRVAALECALSIDPAPCPALLSRLKDESPPVRRALLAAVRERGPNEPRWVPHLIARLPETTGLERLECLATLATLTGARIGPGPNLWTEWYEANRAAIEAGTFRAKKPPPDSKASLPMTTAIYGVPLFGLGFVFLLDGTYVVRAPADWEVERTREDWNTGNQAWRKEHEAHQDVQVRELALSLERLPDDGRFALVVGYGRSSNKILGTKGMLRGNARNARKATRLLGQQASNSWERRHVLRELRLAYEIAGSPPSALDIETQNADTAVFVGDGAPQGPYHDVEATLQVFIRWNRFCRLRVHTVRISNAAGGERLLRGIAEASGGTYRWQSKPP